MSRVLQCMYVSLYIFHSLYSIPDTLKLLKSSRYPKDFYFFLFWTTAHLLNFRPWLQRKTTTASIMELSKRRVLIQIYEDPVSRSYFKELFNIYPIPYNPLLNTLKFPQGFQAVFTNWVSQNSDGFIDLLIGDCIKKILCNSVCCILCDEHYCVFYHLTDTFTSQWYKQVGSLQHKAKGSILSYILLPYTKSSVNLI